MRNPDYQVRLVGRAIENLQKVIEALETCAEMKYAPPDAMPLADAFRTYAFHLQMLKTRLERLV